MKLLKMDPEKMKRNCIYYNNGKCGAPAQKTMFGLAESPDICNWKGKEISCPFAKYQ